VHPPAQIMLGAELGSEVLSRILEQPQDVAVEVGDSGHQAAAADVVRRLLHGRAGSGHLGQLRLDVATCQWATGEVMPCGPPPGTSPMC
jgi:hypothetical protein